MSAARDRALVALAKNQDFARSLAANTRGRTAAVVMPGSNAVAVFLPGPTRGRVVIRFEGERDDVTITGGAVRRLFG